MGDIKRKEVTSVLSKQLPENDLKLNIQRQTLQNETQIISYLKTKAWSSLITMDMNVYLHLFLERL